MPQSCGNSKVARGKRNRELASAEIDVSVELAREMGQEKQQDTVMKK